MTRLLAAAHPAAEAEMIALLIPSVVAIGGLMLALAVMSFGLATAAPRVRPRRRRSRGEARLVES